MLVCFLSTALLACSSNSEGPQEEWNDRYIFSYDEDEDNHYVGTLVDGDDEYWATFDDFMKIQIFNEDAKIEWTKVDENTWLLVTSIYGDIHRFKLQKVLTAKGNEGVDILSWSMNDYQVEGIQKTGNFHKLLDTKEYYLLLQAEKDGKY
jgi:hypothetical protein